MGSIICTNSPANTLTSTLDETLGQKPQGKQRLWGSWKLGLSGQTYADQTDSQSFASFGIGLRGGLSLLEDLDFNGELSLIAQSGFSQTRFGRDSLNDGINLHEAILSYDPSKYITVDAGIINQGHLGQELLVSSRPFPGLRQTLQYDISDITFGLKAQQTIPTSRSLDTHTRSEKEKTPSFLTETLFANYSPTSRLGFTGHITRYQFNNLPTHVAYESRLIGNTVPHSTPAESQFLYDFKGLAYGVSAQAQIMERIGVDLNGQLLENREAPDAFNRGYSLQLGVTLEIFEQQLRASVTNFFNESDSAPAYYNSSRLGHNNRKGNAFGLEAIISQNIKISTHFVDSDVINPNLSMTRQQHLTVALETVYADF